MNTPHDVPHSPPHNPQSEGPTLTDLDAAFARFLQQVQPSANPLHSPLAALVSHQFGLGHACLDLADLSPALREAAPSLPWIQSDGTCHNSPLVLDGPRLYLRRNWVAEQSIRNAIAQRLAQPCDVPVNVAQSLHALFPPVPAAPEGEDSAGPDWQKVACALAARSRFTLITGGPGTGKTTTVVRLLALLQADPARLHAPLRIALAAPTGKAAARLGESIASALQTLPSHMQHHIPAQAQTLHKLLQVRSSMAQDTLPTLATDVVVVDEASMIDLDMMVRLLAAVPLSASLILLGDKDQLASVEAGAVMGQLCATAALGNYSAQTQAWLAHVTGADLHLWAESTEGSGTALEQQTVMLRHSRRFTAGSQIGQWAQAVNAGDGSAVQALWQPGSASLETLALAGWQAWREQLYAVQSPTAPACSDAQAIAALQAFAHFQVLCALRKGPWGVQALNARIASSLGFPSDGWYAGRPVMVTRNDYVLGLMNGDVGLCLPHASGLRVAFGNGQGGIRWVLPSRLDAVESVFAMTVHKSQGSEFAHVCLVLPDAPVAVLTRELLYTGITRAKERLSLVAPRPSVLLRAVDTRVLRAGGLLAQPLPLQHPPLL
jgi:exodeoxyribonuclease V alpha subunit